jgi:protein-disulfide isomerase
MSIHANMSGWEFNEFQCKILERVLNYMFMNKLVNYKGISNDVRIYLDDHMT